jgi:hypothetical protein
LSRPGAGEPGRRPTTACRRCAARRAARGQRPPCEARGGRVTRGQTTRPHPSRTAQRPVDVPHRLGGEAVKSPARGPPMRGCDVGAQGHRPVVQGGRALALGGLELEPGLVELGDGRRRPHRDGSPILLAEDLPQVRGRLLLRGEPDMERCRGSRPGRVAGPTARASGSRLSWSGTWSRFHSRSGHPGSSPRARPPADRHAAARLCHSRVIGVLGRRGGRAEEPRFRW